LLKRPLPIRTLSKTRLSLGVIGGVAFAAAFYFASVAVVSGGGVVLAGLPDSIARQLHYQRGETAEFVPARGPWPEPPPVPVWMAPFWAGLSAAYGG
jgi:hypothetical protein